MRKLMLVLAGFAAVSACSDGRDHRIPATDNSAQQPDLTLPDTASLSDTSSFTVSSRSSQPVSPVEQAPPVPRPRTRATPPAKRAAPVPDTTTRAYAPSPPRDTASAPDSVAADSAVATDTATAPGADTVVTPTSDSVAAPVTDTVATAPSARPGADTKARTLPTGTEIHAALDDSITSRRDTVGRIVSAHVMENVTGPDGRTLIAAGTPVRFTVTRLRAARSKESQGRLALRADGIALNGQLQPVKAEVRPVPRELRGRGVTGSEAGKVGAGAVGGAVLGRVVGGNTRGAVIGGVAGAAAGAVVANQTATRDVVVKAKTPVVIVLIEPLTAP